MIAWPLTGSPTRAWYWVIPVLGVGIPPILTKLLLCHNNFYYYKIKIDYILKIENIHNKKVQTLILPFKKFYLAEDYHQDYYKKNSIRYNYYKYSCGREQRIKQLKINLRWSKF